VSVSKPPKPSEPPETAAPLVVIKGEATPEEVAALVAVVSGMAAAQHAAAAAAEQPPASEWGSPRRKVRAHHPHGPGGWRASGLPR
jgi:hypothetical protein